MSRNLLPWTNFKICSYCSFAWPSLTRSILFCKIRMCFSFMISIAAKCSDVCGWGHDSFPAKQTLHSYYLNQLNMFNTFAATWPEYRSRRLCSLHTAYQQYRFRMPPNTGDGRTFALSAAQWVSMTECSVGRVFILC